MPSPVALALAPRVDHFWPDDELPLLLAALAERGVDARGVPWHEPDIDWSGFSLVIPRSTWDLYWHFEDFLGWVEKTAAATTLLNPPETLRWGLDKRYLRQLASAGVPVVPTTVVEPGERPEFGEGEFVVKPVTSGGAVNTARYTAAQHEAAGQHVATLHGQGLAALVQPYVASVDVEGERSLMFFDGVFSHAVVKSAVIKPDEPFDVLRESFPDVRPWHPTEAELAAARAALRVVPGEPPLLYARVDVVSALDGAPSVMEVEVAEPWLFLAEDEGAAGRYATAIAARIDTSHPV